MKASLDTNVLIHLYSAGKQELLFDLFKDGVFIYEQIRKVELENHGHSVLAEIDRDIANSKIVVYEEQKLRELGVYRIFTERLKETRNLYGPGDMGEVYAIALAQTLGAYSLVTDDIKQGGPYMSLLQFVDEDVRPFNFVDLILLKYLAGGFSAAEAIECFNEINNISGLKWSFRSHVARFIQRFWTEPYQKSEREWMISYCRECGVDFVTKMKTLREYIK